jgi:hypothetical protein
VLAGLHARGRRAVRDAGPDMSLWLAQTLPGGRGGDGGDAGTSRGALCMRRWRRAASRC